MPAATVAARGGARKYRTIRVGKGASARYIHVAIVPKRGKRGGKTIGGPVRRYKGAHP